MPLPSTRVIPDGWSEHHQPVSEDAMPGLCRITVPGTGSGTYDPVTKKTTPPPPRTLATDVSCRVQATQGSDRLVVSGDQTITLRGYLATVPADTVEVPVGATVILTDCPNDEQLVGRPLQVLDVLRGTEAWERVLVCQDNEG